MHAYIINMDAAVDRWQYVSQGFAATGIPFTRVSGVNGRQLQPPIAGFDEARFRRRHGQRPDLGGVGCYLSHLKALRLFLDSSYETAIIAEDDAHPAANLRQLIERAMLYQASWDLLRLSGFHHPHAAAFAALDDTHQLCVCFTRLCGAAAYLVTRRAARAMVAGLSPMSLPYDHAFDREWNYGLRAAAIIPLPVAQEDHDFRSQIAGTDKLHWARRYWTVFPWRLWNESSRVIQRSRQLWRARAIARGVDSRAPHAERRRSA